MSDQADHEALEAVHPTGDLPADEASVQTQAAEPGPSVEADEPGAPTADAAEGEEAEASGAESDAPAGEEGAKKKRRRRRKKKKGEGAEGAEAPAEGGEVTEGAAPERKAPPPLPFHHFFDSSLRRHLFAVGETIAGMVSRIEDDVAVIDVFGKATAFARLCEPREIPVVEIPVEDSSAGTLSAPGMESAAADLDAAYEDEAAESAMEAPEASAPIESAPAEGPESAPIESAPAEGPESAPAEAAESAPVQAGDATSPETEAPKADEPPAVIHYAITPEGVPPIPEGSVFRGRIAAIAESGHLAIVNELVDRKQTRRWLARARDERERVPGLVFGYNRGGFDVLLAGVRAFCPVNGMTLDAVHDPAMSLGVWHEFHVQTVKGGSQGLVVSRRSILERDARKNARVFLKSLQPGTKLVGRVTSVREFGIFVDIGHGAEGLVHQSEISFDRAARPADVAKPGDSIEVQVLKVQGADRKKKERFDRVSLSIKALLPDPFDQHSDALAEGIPRKGVVVRTAEFGAFIQLAPGIDGLLHITELGKDLKHAGEVVKEGDELHVVIERIDRKARRISLSKLSADEVGAYERGELEPASRAPRAKQGGALKVVVTQVTPVGLHVKIDNVIGKRGRGFIPNAEMGTPRGTDHRKKWPPGTEIDVTVIGTDRDGGLRCSRKRFLQDEERRAVKEYRKEASKQGLGTFADILRSKLGIDQGSSS